MQRILPFRMSERTARLGLLLILVAVHFVGPLLHAHMGTPRQTGIHLDVPVLDRLNAIRADCDTPVAVQCHREGEPFSIEVEKGISHSSQSMQFDPTLVQALLAFFAVLLVPVARAGTLRLSGTAPMPLRWRGGSSRPPPSHAPPFTS